MIASIRELRASAAAAHIVPLVTFLVLMAPVSALKTENSLLPWYKQAPELWIYPVQTLICAGLLAFFWKHYQFRPFRGMGLAVVLGLVTIALWILPSRIYGWIGLDDPDGETFWFWLGVADRSHGFNPTLVENHPLWFNATIALRFLRMVVIVPFVEEIFWRGFLMRWLVDTDRPFTKTPFGTFQFRAVAITTVAVVLAHVPQDYLATLIFASAMAWLAIKTKSLGACVLMHAVANLALGLYVVVTKQWGFW